MYPITSVLVAYTGNKQQTAVAREVEWLVHYSKDSSIFYDITFVTSFCDITYVISLMETTLLHLVTSLLCDEF